MIRRGMGLLAVVVLGLALVGCTKDSASDGAEWLAKQQGVVSVETLDSDSSLSGTTGTIRGELSPDLTDDALASLVKSVAGYVNSNSGVSIRLGRDGVDFGIDADADNDTAVSLWQRVSKVGTVVNGIVYPDSVHARVMRPDLRDALAALDGLGVDLQVEGFTDQAALDADTAEDDETADATGNRDSLAVSWAASCDPDQAQQIIASSFYEQAEVRGADLQFCQSFDVYYVEGAPFSTLLPTLYADLVTGGISDFPVVAYSNVGGALDGRYAVVAPGDPAAFAVFAPFDEARLPASLTLNDDRSLEVIDYDVPLADLVTVIESAPVAATLPFIRVEGEDAAVGGLLAELDPLVVEVIALVAANPEFANVELNVDAGLLALSSPLATDPDIPAAVASLRASGAAATRTFIVTYLQSQVNIVDGVATVPTEYTDGHVVEAFADEWNATAP